MNYKEKLKENIKNLKLQIFSKKQKNNKPYIIELNGEIFNGNVTSLCELLNIHYGNFVNRELRHTKYFEGTIDNNHIKIYKKP